MDRSKLIKISGSLETLPYKIVSDRLQKALKNTSKEITKHTLNAHKLL